jgi:hypothetical protein
MSLDEEGRVCYLVGEKRIGGGGNKKEAVGTAIIRGKIGTFVVGKELGMTLKDSYDTTQSRFKIDPFLNKQDVCCQKIKCSPTSTTSLVSSSSFTFK